LSLKTKVVEGFLVWASKLVGMVWWVSQFASKTGEVRQRVVHVVLSRRLGQGQVEYGRVDAMGYIGPCYTCFVVFIVLCLMGILVF
jgi:hypothetical protein